MKDVDTQILRQIIRQELGKVATAELGIVQEQHPADPDNYACTIRLRDSGIVLAKVPVAVSRIGAAAIPPIGGLVLVQFIGGDINAPVITGSLYNEEDRPPENADGEVVWNLPNDAGEGDALRLTARSVDAKSVHLAVGGALEVTLQDDDPVVVLDVGGNASITVASDGQVTIESSRGLEVKSNEIAISGDGNVEISAGGELKLQGSIINLN